MPRQGVDESRKQLAAHCSELSLEFAHKYIVVGDVKQRTLHGREG